MILVNDNRFDVKLPFLLKFILFYKLKCFCLLNAIYINKTKSMKDENSMIYDGGFDKLIIRFIYFQRLRNLQKKRGLLKNGINELR